MKRFLAHIGFSAAVTLLAVNLMPVYLVYAVLAGLAVMLTVSLLLRTMREALTAPLCLSAAVFACLIFLTVYNGTVVPAQSLSGKTEDAVIYLTAPAEQRDGKYTYTAVLDTVSVDGAPQGIKIHLTSDEPITADVYQYIHARIRFSKCGDNAFNSYGYWGKGIYLYGNIRSCRATHDYVKTPMRRIMHIRRDILETLTAAAQGDSGALAAAMLTGDKSKLSAAAYNDFKMSGLLHVMAVSGLHLSVVCGGLAALLKLLRVNKNTRAVLVIISILLYAALSGFSKSIIRAGIMLGIMMLADLTEHRGDTLNSLGAAVFIICLNPFAVSDVSAVLSVLAVLSLLTLYPLFYKKCCRILHFHPQYRTAWQFLWKKPTDFLLKSVLASGSVLLLTLPAMVFFFNGVSLASLFANVPMLPLASLQVVLSLLSYLSLKTGFLPSLFVWASKLTTSLLLKTAHAAAGTGFDLVFGKYFALALGICAAVFAVCFIAAKKEWLKPAAVFCAVLMGITVCTQEVTSRSACHVLLSDECGYVISHDKTVVWGVRTRSDYLTVGALLGSRHDRIDLLLCSSDDNRYAIQLAEDYGCVTAVIPTAADRETLPPADDWIITSRYTDTAESGFAVSYYCDVTDYNILFEMNDVTVCCSSMPTKAADITASGGTVTDARGTVSVTRAPVIYDIYSDNYEARRVDAWQD